MKKNKKQKRLLAAAAALAATTLIAGTFAWLTAQDQRVNRLESLAISDGSVSVNETFEPTPIQAGASATKEVSITNGGSAPVYVRVSFEEVLKYLKEGAEETGRAQAWKEDTTNAATKAGVGVDVPVEINKDSSKYTGWTDITAKIKDVNTSAALAGDYANVKVMAKGSYTFNSSTNKYVQEFDYMMYVPYTIGGVTKYQKVSGDLVVKNVGTAPTTEADWDYEIDASTIKFYAYASGYTFNVVNWAEGILPGQKGDGTATGPDAATGTALLGAKGTRYGKDFDYRNQTATGLIPDATLTAGTPAHLLGAGDYPTAAGDVKAIQADTASVLGNKISITYGADIVPTTSLADAKWVYNEEDGWFYFTSPLGTGKTTPDLLKSVDYASDIDKQYSNATYDLVVKMEAMQYVDEALEGSDGFNLNGHSTISTTIASQMKGATVYK